MSDSIFLFNGNDPYIIVSEKTQADDSQNDTISINSDAQIAIILEDQSGHFKHWLNQWRKGSPKSARYFC